MRILLSSHRDLGNLMSQWNGTRTSEVINLIMPLSNKDRLTAELGKPNLKLCTKLFEICFRARLVVTASKMSTFRFSSYPIF